ncbi:MAG: FHA domain-containing protein, partial [Chloroflexota bacterium]
MSTQKLSLLIWFAILLLPAYASAQARVHRLEVTEIDASSFPEVDVLVRPFDIDGRPVEALTESEFVVLEDGEPVTNLVSKTEERGVAVHFLIDAGSTLINTSNDPRWNRAVEALSEFAVNRPAMLDGDDLVTIQVVEAGGPVDLIRDASNGGDIRAAMQSYEPPGGRDYADLLPVAIEALNRLETEPQYAGMSKILIILSGDLQISKEADINRLAQQANSFQISLHSILLKPTATEYSQSLREVADKGNGFFVEYRDPSSLNGLFSELSAHRLQYRLSFESTLGVSASREIEVQADTSVGRSAYEVQINLPSVGITSPENGSQIIQTVTEESRSATTQTVIAEVTTDPPRRLAKAVLYVDGIVVDTAETPRKDLTFTWELPANLSGGTNSYQIRVEVEDVLGLVNSNDLHEVSVVADIQNSEFLTAEEAAALIEAERANTQESIDSAINAENEAALIVCFVPEALLDGALCNIERSLRSNLFPMIAILISLGAVLFVWMSKSAPAELIRTTLTDVGARLTKQFRPVEAKGYLIILEGDGVNIGRKLPIYGTTPIGRSGAHAQLLFHQNKDDSPISRLHCTILDQEDHFLLRDEESGNGTFLNGAQLKREEPPVYLRNGDEIELALV